MMEGWNRGMLGQKTGKKSIFIENESLGAEPIIPRFHYSMVPVLSGARRTRASWP
jgi:hypothetical protein